MNNKSNAKKINPVGWLNDCSSTNITRRLFARKKQLALATAMTACIVSMASSVAHAALMAYEGFNYPGSSNLTGQNGGFGWNGVWQQQVNGDSSVPPGGSLNAASAPPNYNTLSAGNSAFTPNQTREGRFLDTSAGGSFGVNGYVDGNGNIGAAGKTIYISFMQQASDINNYYEFELHRGNLNDGGRMSGIGNDTGDSNVHLRYETPAGGSSTFYTVGPGNTGVNFYVVRIDYSASGDTVTVYQNPTSATEAGATAQLVQTGLADMSFNGISFGAFNGGSTVAHDEVRLGTTWADVTSPGATSTGLWNGGGANNNWSTGGNWDNGVVPIFSTSLTFAGSTRLNNTNDLTGVSANSITFDSAAGAFTLNGNSLGLIASANIAFNANPSSPITQTISLPLATAGDITVGTRTNGSITVNGNITGGNQLTQAGPDNAGVLTLAGTNSLKGLVVNNGTNIITGNTTINGIGGSSFFYVPDAGSGRNATLIIQNGATLTITNGFQDAAVIARNGANGKIIQNGGTFNFAINDGSHNYLFVGASDQPNAHAEYDMNGGVLDMNGDTLGVGLGVNGPVGADITGVVNQTGGVITNVLNLYFSPLIANGNGIYNLTGGSIYIGSGGITVFSGGAYQMNLGGGTIAAEESWSSALNMNLTGVNGPVTFNTAGNNITLSGTLSGSGGLTKAGSGTLEFTVANTYTGDTTVNAGTLQLDVGGASSSAIHLANGATLNLTFPGSRVVPGLFTNGVALPIGTYSSGNLGGFISGSGTLQVASSISTGLWTGGGANNNWSTAGNWDQNAVPVFPIGLTFAGSAKLANNNDLSSITASSFTFDAAAGAFNLSGNPIGLNGNIGFNGNPAAPITQTVNLDMTWTANVTLNTPTNGNLILGGNISSPANSLTKIGAGTLTLTGGDSFAGYSVNGGTNIATGNTTVSGVAGNRFYVGDGDAVPGSVAALVIPNGAAFNFTGSYDDYLVIGRDSANGRIIQNGGTFDFNPSDGHNILLVAAGGAAHGYGEYDINDGVLDLHGNTLGAGWGDGGAVTGVVNQAGGAISSVFNLNLGVVKANGIGTYNLTGGSIAIDFGGITSDSGLYNINLGGGTISAISGWVSPLDMTLTGINGPVTFDTAGGGITLSGTLSGPGGLNVAGGGILELSGATTYSGDTTVNSGILQLDAAGSTAGAFRVVDGGLFYLTYSGNYVVAALYVNGSPLPIGIYNSGNLSSYISGSGGIQVVGNVSTGIWDGGGSDNNWSTAGNWDHNAVPIFPLGLTFAGGTRLANNNDLPGITASSITFDAAAGAFVIGGNDITLSGNIGFNGNPAAPVTQTVNLNMAWNASKTIDIPANGNLALGGNITSVNALLKVDAGTLTLGGNDSFASYQVNGGTNIITGTTTINGTGGATMYVGNGGTGGINGCTGALVIQPGGTLAFIGTYADAFVLGRDSGSGTITQNGGTLSFNPENQTLFLIAATSDSRTRAEYDMNGGLFDMSGKELGIGFGNTLSTGLVYQVSGVITNVGNMDIPFTGGGNGFGAYTLSGGSIYIGSGGITSDSARYAINLGGGKVGALASWSSPLNMTLTGVNGPVTFDTAGNNIVLSGALSGNGGLTKAGSGTLELSGADTYTGNTTVNAGILKLDVAGTSSSVVRIVSGATLNLTYTGTITVPACYTNGVALASGVYTSANLPGFITGLGSLTVSGATTPPVVNSPVISGGNLILTGSGGTAGAGYIWLSSTNLATPVASWITNTTGSFDGNGNFSNAIPVSAATPAQFFRLKTQ